jgi:hypothetical protein
MVYKNVLGWKIETVEGQEMRPNECLIDYLIRIGKGSYEEAVKDPFYQGLSVDDLEQLVIQLSEFKDIMKQSYSVVRGNGSLEFFVTRINIRNWLEHKTFSPNITILSCSPLIFRGPDVEKIILN